MSIPVYAPLMFVVGVTFGRAGSALRALAPSETVTFSNARPPRDKPGGLGSLHQVSQEQRLAFTLVLPLPGRV